MPIRRLPVLQDASTADPERPPWHWVAIGVLFIVSVFAPLAMLAAWVGQRATVALLGEGSAEELAHRLAVASSSVRMATWFAVAGTPVVAYMLACFAAGALVGRFGAQAGPKEATRAGALAACLGWAAVFAARGSWVTSFVALLVLLSLACASSYAGGRLGFRLRAKSATRVAPPRQGES